MTNTTKSDSIPHVWSQPHSWALASNSFEFFVLGIVLLRTKSIDKFIDILVILGAVAFPLSRISRTQWVATITDALLLIPLSILALRILSGKRISSQ